MQIRSHNDYQEMARSQNLIQKDRRGCETGVLHVYVFASEALVEKTFCECPTDSASQLLYTPVMTSVKNAESTCRNVAVFKMYIKWLLR